MYIEDEDNKTKGSTVADEDTGLAVGAGGSGPSPDSSKASDNNAPAQPDNSRNQQFATVQDYLKANTQQGNDLGDAFSSKLDTSLGNEKSAIDTSANSFGNEVAGGTVFNNQPLVNEAANTPTQVANDPNNLTNWLKQYNAAYTGPASFESSDVYAPAAAAGQEATQNANLVKDTGGREQLLQNEFNDYGQGNRGLDQALLQNSGKSADIQAFAPKFAGVADYLNNASTNAANNVTGAETTTQAAKDTAHTAVDNKLGDLGKSLADRVTSMQGVNSGVGSKIASDFQAGKADAVAADLTTAGIPQDQIKAITDYLRSINTDYSQSPDISNYYTPASPANINTETVATPGEFGNAAAWGTLTGQDSSSLLNPANSALAGTAQPAGAGAVNSADLTSYLKNSLGSQDKQFLGGLDATQINAVQNDPSAGTALGTKLVDAMKRSGITGTNSNGIPPALSAAYAGWVGNRTKGVPNAPGLDALFAPMTKYLFGGS